MIISRELDALITAEHKAGYYATVQQLYDMRYWQDERKAIKEKIACAFDELRERADEAEHQRDELLAACKDLIEYRNRNTLNFQLEKADDFINRMRAVVDSEEGEK